MSDAPETVTFEGRQRQVVGRLHYPEPPEPGTLVGPNGWGERCVVLGASGADTLIGLAIADDISRATAVVARSGPRSELERSL